MSLLNNIHRTYIEDSLLKNDRLSYEYGSYLAKIFRINSNVTNINITDFKYVLLSIDGYEKISNDYKEILKKLVVEHYNLID